MITLLQGGGSGKEVRINPGALVSSHSHTYPSTLHYELRYLLLKYGWSLTSILNI